MGMPVGPHSVTCCLDFVDELRGDVGVCQADTWLSSKRSDNCVRAVIACWDIFAVGMLKSKPWTARADGWHSGLTSAPTSRAAYVWRSDLTASSDPPSLTVGGSLARFFSLAVDAPTNLTCAAARTQQCIRTESSAVSIPSPQAGVLAAGGMSIVSSNSRYIYNCAKSSASTDS